MIIRRGGELTREKSEGVGPSRQKVRKSAKVEGKKKTLNTLKSDGKHSRDTPSNEGNPWNKRKKKTAYRSRKRTWEKFKQTERTENEGLSVDLSDGEIGRPWV